MKLKKGDIVGRKSYNCDIFFIIDRIIKLNSTKKIAILKGIDIRIEADAVLEDLELIEAKVYQKRLDEKERLLFQRLKTIEEIKRSNNISVNGKILHLDGDKRYSEKSLTCYKKLGLNAVVRNIAEREQPKLVRKLLDRYKPDILVITGHDAMLKNGSNYANIYNYRNSKYFIESVKEARKLAKTSEKLSIFAGACQSFFEALIMAGADFASSPGRILIDFIDPIIIAEKIATTDSNKFITAREITKQISEGERGIGGIGTKGKKRYIKLQM